MQGLLGAVLWTKLPVPAFPFTGVTDVTAELVAAVLQIVSHFWFLLMSPFLKTRAGLFAPRLEEKVS